MFHTPGSTAKGHISLDRAHQLEDKKNRPCSILNYHQLPSQTVFLLQVKALGLRLWPPSHPFECSCDRNTHHDACLGKDLKLISTIDTRNTAHLSHKQQRLFINLTTALHNQIHQFEVGIIDTRNTAHLSHKQQRLCTIRFINLKWAWLWLSHNMHNQIHQFEVSLIHSLSHDVTAFPDCSRWHPQ